MAKHKAKWNEHTAAYISHGMLRSYQDFIKAVNIAKLTGDWDDAISKRLRGRVGSKVRSYSEMLRVRVPKKWW